MNNSYRIKQFIMILYIMGIGMFFNACVDEDTTVDCTPISNINAIYNLNLPSFSNLNIPAGYVVLPPDGTNGTRGLILYNHNSKGIIAYDRNAPHICPTPNSTLEVEDGIVIYCPEDDAQWLIRSGSPLNDQTQGRSPRQFYVQQTGNTIVITN